MPRIGRFGLGTRLPIRFHPSPFSYVYVMIARPSLDDLLRDVPPEKLKQPCSDEDLCEIALDITEWQSIAPHLGVSEKEITDKYPNQLKRRKIEMLRKWREVCGSAATYQALVEVLWQKEKTEQAEKLCSLLVSPKTKNITEECISASSSSSRDFDSTPPASKRIRIISSTSRDFDSPLSSKQICISSSNSSQTETLDGLLQDIMGPQDDESYAHCLSRPVHVVDDPLLISFSGPLATQWFKKFDRAFYTAIHAGKAKVVESVAEKMLSTNFCIDFKAIALLYRASCRALLTGKMDEALLDCDRAIERAKLLDCQNGALITGRALRYKTSILRTLGKCDEALECLKGAKEQYFLAAPSYDTASLLYEEVRLKIQLVNSKRMVVNFSDVKNDYSRIVKHLDYLEGNRSHLCVVVLNAQAEVLLRTYYIKEDLPSTEISPTEDDLCSAEYLLNCVPHDKLPAEAYVYRGWHYLARADLCMWRKQYPEAIEWAEKSQDQFASGNVKHIDNPQERIKLINKLQAEEIQETKQLDEIIDQLSA